MINYLVDSLKLKVMDSGESLELACDILDSDDSMCWSDEYIDLTPEIESDLEPPAASHLDTAASTQSTNGADKYRSTSGL